MPQLFISYSHNDRVLAETLALNLQQEGYEAWIDFDGLIGGDVWEKAIERAIQEADCLLVVVTAAALTSEWVKKEISLARACETRVIPLLMARLEQVPEALAALSIADLQAVDFVIQGLQHGYQQLLRGLPEVERPALPESPSSPQVQQQVNQMLGGAVIGQQHNLYLTSASIDSQDVVSLHQAYLWSWFSKPWASVSLADIAGTGEQVSLLDIYVPLPVDFSITIQIRKQQIVDWWAKVETPDPEATALKAAEDRPRLREWPSLRVGEAALQAIVNEIQRKIAARGEKPDDDDHHWTMEAHDAASVQPRLVLVGDAGSGKSSFVRHLVLCLAGAQLHEIGAAHVPEKASLEALRDWLLGAYTPIYIELRDLVTQVFPALPAEKSAPAELPTLDHFWRYIEKHILGEALAAYQSHLQKRLLEGGVIILLDGLDEVAEAADPRRRAQIKAFIGALEVYRGARIIVTSRPYAYRQSEWVLSGYGRTDLLPLYPARLRELAQALFAILMPERADAEAQAFFQAAERVPADLRHNPLFFTLLAAIWLKNSADHALPESRGELYRTSFDLMLEKWTLRKGFSWSVADLLGLTSEQLRAALEQVACTVHGRGQAEGDSTEFHRSLLIEVLLRLNDEVAPGKIWKHLEQRAGILVSGRDEHFRFAHRSFQEHLAACYLTCADLSGVPLADRFPQGLVRRVLEQPDLWRNVVRLVVDELLYSGREADVWRLLPELFRPYLHEGDNTHQAQAAALALMVVEEHGLHRQTWDEYSPQHAVLQGIRQTAQRLLHERALPVEQRAEAGRVLSRVGDPRKGVGLDAHGLPDIDWVDIPAGEFIYGDQSEDNGPVTLHLPAYRISRYPITYAQFEPFVAGDGYTNSTYWTAAGWAWKGDKLHPADWHDPDWHIANHPVVGVSWYEVHAFCRWLSDKLGYEVRLPTEQEWEKAARGTDGRKYPYEGEFDPAKGNTQETGIGQTSAVGIFPEGASPYGVEEMSGNVWEWCLNKWRGSYAEAEDNDPAGDAQRVLRGGSFYGLRNYARAVSRDYPPPNYRYGSGCRLVRPPSS